MPDSTETVSEAKPQPRPARHKGRWVDWVLLAFGVACLAVFATQAVRYYRSRPALPTGRIMSGLEPADRIPLSPGDAEGFNLLVITMDTTRADHVGCYGHPGVKTPNIDALARTGVLFAEAFTPSPSTLPGHASIMTGLYPYHHGARANGTFRLKPEQLTLAEILKAKGYATAAVISSYVLDSRFGLDQGFDLYDDDLTKGAQYADYLFRERPAEYANETAFGWLEANANSKFFLWVHYFDPHAPYVPPEPYRSEYQTRPYDGEIAYVDHTIGLLLTKLEDLGVRDRTLVVLAGDHGEGLGEHGEATHSMLVYDSTMHTPLIFSLPKLLPEGHAVRNQVCNTDIVPTVLDLLGVFTEAEFDGTSLLRPAEDRPEGIYIETVCTLVLHGWAPLFGIRHADGKYIHAPTPEYYDLSEDPGELDNVLDERIEEVAALSKELDQHIGDDLYGKGALDGVVTMEPEVAAKMRALGYVGAVRAEPVDVEAAAQFDPKDMVQHWEAVQKGTNLIAAGKLHEGLEILEECAKEVEGDVYALRCLANVYVTMGKLDEAEQTLRRVLKFEETDPGTYALLGRIALSKGDIAAARKLMERARTIDPNFAGALVAMAALAAAQNQIAEAEGYYQQAIEIDPGTTGPGAYVEMGTMYLRSLRHGEAREAFEKAIDVSALNGLAHAGLGSILAEEGKLDEAAREFAVAARYEPNHPVILANLAGLHDKKREYDTARALAERALAINETCTPALNNLGLVMKHTGDLAKAMELFNRASEIDPTYLACRINLAQCYLARREDEKAAEQFEQILRLNPAVPIALANLGVYHVNHGRAERAMQLFARALRVNPDYALVHTHYGALLLQDGRGDEALFHFRKSLELEPDQQGHEELEHRVRMIEQAVRTSTRPTESTLPGSGEP